MLVSTGVVGGVTTPLSLSLLHAMASENIASAAAPAMGKCCEKDDDFIG
jgi:hypothetical protein